jgi:leucyl/phenylalanyl-tRNA--protein transferase
MLARTGPPKIATPRTVTADRAALREQLFRESAAHPWGQPALRFAWTLRHYHIALLPFIGAWIGDRLAPQTQLPDPARTGSDGERAGFVHDLSVSTLVGAYKRGLYTSDHYGPLTWTSLAERCVLFFDELHIAKRLRRLMRQERYTVTFDRAFEHVIKACAGQREGRWHVTWITPRIMYAYAALFDAGHVHSFEVWNKAGELVGGGYGVSMGRVFFTESQFSHEPNTSKLGFTVLNRHLNEWGYVLNDGKRPTPTILNMGFREIPRRDFLRLLADNASSGGKPGRWAVEADLRQIADWHPTSGLTATAE